MRVAARQVRMAEAGVRVTISKAGRLAGTYSEAFTHEGGSEQGRQREAVSYRPYPQLGGGVTGPATHIHTVVHKPRPSGIISPSPA